LTRLAQGTAEEGHNCTYTLSQKMGHAHCAASLTKIEHYE